jgi:hypothetical protein
MKPTRMRSIKYFAALLLISIVAPHLAGCTSYDKWKEGRPKTYVTSGRVLLDGKPEAGVTVTFQPADKETGKPGWAVTDENGNFKAQTFDPGDGLTEGTHRVALKKAQMIDRATGKVVTEVNSDAPLKEQHFVPERYNDFATSNIEVQIKAEKNKLPPFALVK